MQFILTRHLKTDWNAQGRIQGQTDIPLNEQGKADAIPLAESLSKLGIRLIVSSNLQRASQTADIIGRHLHAQVLLDARLRECSFGTVEGLTVQQAIEKYGPEIERHCRDEHQSYDFSKLGGENKLQVLLRHVALLESYSNSDQQGPILFVGHGRGLATLLAHLGQSPDIRQGEYRVIEYD